MCELAAPLLSIYVCVCVCVEGGGQGVRARFSLAGSSSQAVYNELYGALLSLPLSWEIS